MNDAASRKRLERQNRVKEGFRRLEVWAKPHTHERIKAYAKRLNPEGKRK